ncbi:MAG: CDF family Co(II)/Ni(II) efflux transporter DmeF [Bacteriovoracaceae bacterium]
MKHHCPEAHNIHSGQDKLKNNENKTLIVIVITFIMMVVEIVIGNISGSMALTADGWHMASHAGALGISYFAYRLHRSEKIRHHFTFGPGKFIPLGGYTSAVCLGIVAFFMAYESFLRLLHPVSIHYTEAITVAVIGLVVNLASALILKDDHHHSHGHVHANEHKHQFLKNPKQEVQCQHDHHDHNLRSAYIHVMADALTSVLAILALLLGKYFQLVWMDALMGVIGGIVIFKWALSLCKETAFELLDGEAKAVSHLQVKEFMQNYAQVIDIHIWKIGPETLALELVLATDTQKGPDFYRELLKQKFSFKHIVIEERLSQTNA